jgi:hypothetical protein
MTWYEFTARVNARNAVKEGHLDEYRRLLHAILINNFVKYGSIPDRVEQFMPLPSDAKRRRTSRVSSKMREKFIKLQKAYLSKKQQNGNQ